MKARIVSLWESTHTSFWFLPALAALAAVGLAFGMESLDKALSSTKQFNRLFYPGNAEGARQVLSTVAGSTITVIGVIFSITIAALTLASSQFGPRLLRNFMADKGNQTVLAVFLGTFVYSLLVLRTVEGSDGGGFVPRIAVTFGIVLALTSFAVLIYFFHHVSSAIQAEQVVDTIYRELVGEIDRTFPREPESADASQAPRQPVPSFASSAPASMVTAKASGYLRVIDVNGLMSLAIKHDLVIRLEHRPGDFVFEGTPLVRIAAPGEISDALHARVRRAFVLGKFRSLEQDVEFPIQELVDMALRALSPSLNDPYTAVNCIDRLGAAICHLNGRHAPPVYRYDQAKKLRLILDLPTYEGILDAAFNQVRQNVHSSVAASLRLLEALQAIAVTACDDAQCSVLRLHAEMVYRAGQEAAREKRDREDLDERFRGVTEKLQASSTKPNHH